MKRTRDEVERPGEWLRGLNEEPGRYRRLLDDSGSLALCAHRIASARCRVSGTSVSVPTGTELYAAARLIQSHVPTIDRIPRAVDLACECDDAGVPVMPTSYAA